MAGHFDVTPVVDFEDNGIHIALRGMDWIEAEMPKQSTSAMGEYLKYGAETERKGVLKITNINPQSVEGDVVYPVGNVHIGENVVVNYTSTYKTVRVNLIVIDEELPSQQAVSPGTKKNPVCIDLDEEIPPEPVPTIAVTAAVGTTAANPVQIDIDEDGPKKCPFCKTDIDANDNEALVVDKVKPNDPVWDECPICHEIRPKMIYKCCDKKQYSCLSCAKKVGFLPPKNFDEEEK